MGGGPLQKLGPTGGEREPQREGQRGGLGEGGEAARNVVHPATVAPPREWRQEHASAHRLDIPRIHRAALPPHDGPVVLEPPPVLTAENCRCWRCWRCPCTCPPGQGLRGPIPLELRADQAAPPAAPRELRADPESVWPGTFREDGTQTGYPYNVVRDPEAVLPGRFDGKWGARDYLAAAAALEDRAALCGPPPDVWTPPLPERCLGGCGTAARFLAHGAWCSHHWRLVSEHHRAAIDAAQDLETYARAVAAARTAVAAEERRRFRSPSP